MSANALVQTRIDANVKVRAAQVLDHLDLTVSDVVRIVLTRIANEGELPFGFATDPAAHDAWFRTKVLEAISDSRPAIPGDAVETHLAKRRASKIIRSRTFTSCSLPSEL